MLPPERMGVSRSAGSMSIDALEPTVPPRWRMLHGNILGRSRRRPSPDPLAPALFGLPFLGFCGRMPPQVPPDATADQEENDPRRRGHEYHDDPLDPIRLPERRDGEREDQGYAQRGEDRRSRHHANPYHQAQAPGTHPSPLIAGWGRITPLQPELVSTSAIQPVSFVFAEVLMARRT